MIGKNEVSNALDGAFRAAFMLTGSTQAAERAVFDGIAATEFDSVVDDVFPFRNGKGRDPTASRFCSSIAAATFMPPSRASAAVSTRADLSRLFRIANSPWPNTSDLLANTASHDRRGTSDALRCIGGAPVPRSWQLTWHTIHSPRRQGSSGRTKRLRHEYLRYTCYFVDGGR